MKKREKIAVAKKAINLLKVKAIMKFILIRRVIILQTKIKIAKSIPKNNKKLFKKHSKQFNKLQLRSFNQIRQQQLQQEVDTVFIDSNDKMFLLNTKNEKKKSTFTSMYKN
jgi:hypothetical protein